MATIKLLFFNLFVFILVFIFLATIWFVLTFMLDVYFFVSYIISVAIASAFGIIIHNNKEARDFCSKYSEIRRVNIITRRLNKSLLKARR